MVLLAEFPMAATPTLPRAPLTEAILDIHLAWPDGVSGEAFRAVHREVESRFPHIQAISPLELSFKLEAGSRPFPILPNSGEPAGFFFRSDGGGKVLQLRAGGFAFHKLHPYEDWDSFSAEAQELWSIVLRVLPPVSVRRLELRYINRIELPLDFEYFSEYIRTLPEIAPDIPQALSSAELRLVIPFEQGIMAIIREAIEPFQQGMEACPILFDIDVFKDVELPPDSADIWSVMLNLRDTKNRIFFATFTEKALELFK